MGQGVGEVVGCLHVVPFHSQLEVFTPKDLRKDTARAAVKLIGAWQGYLQSLGSDECRVPALKLAGRSGRILTRIRTGELVQDGVLCC